MDYKSNTFSSEQESTWSDRHWLLAILLVATGVVLRFYNLGDKPYHHDEAIFGMYAFYHFDNPQTGFYKYIPMLNGPLLFHLQAQIFKFFGATDFTGRLIPAVLGSSMLFIPFLFRKKLSSGLFYTILALICLSPVFIYFSRFLRHEYLVISCYVLFLYFLLQKPSNLKFFILPFLFWLHWCIKENVYVFAAIIIGFLIFDAMITQFKKKYLLDKEVTTFSSTYLKTTTPIQLVFVAIGLLAGFILFYLLYSNFGVFNDGFLDGICRQSFSYWFNQHSIERIKGPFAIHFMMLNWYELCAFLFICFAYIAQCLQYYSKTQKYILLYFIVALTCITLVFTPTILDISLFRDFFKLKFSLDVFLFFFYIFIAVMHTSILLWNKLKIEGLLYYLFISHLFTYSYLGEKVPWLVLYPLLFGLIYATHTFYKQEIWQKYLNWKVNGTLSLSGIIMLVILSSNFYQAVRLNFFRSANIEEFIIQVHPVHAYKNALNHIINTINIKKFPTPPSILMIDDSTWISTWYFKHARLPTTFSREAKPLDQHDIILSKDPNLAVMETHNKIEVDYSGWWVPDYDKFSFINFYAYSFNHIAWNVSGLMKYYIYTRKGFYEP
jgi:uncharacterized protein (TIGR03663 family)